MKAKLFLLLTLSALALPLSPALAIFKPAEPQLNGAALSCTSYCSRVRCIGDYICGPYVNPQGQTVCGCHPR